MFGFLNFSSVDWGCDKYANVLTITVQRGKKHNQPQRLRLPVILYQPYNDLINYAALSYSKLTVIYKVVPTHFLTATKGFINM